MPVTRSVNRKSVQDFLDDSEALFQRADGSGTVRFGRHELSELDISGEKFTFPEGGEIHFYNTSGGHQSGGKAATRSPRYFFVKDETKLVSVQVKYGDNVQFVYHSFPRRTRAAM